MNMIKWAEEEQKYDYVGVGNAIFAWGWLTIGDYYGEVILDNAFNNDGSPFTYQTQDKVYKKVIEYCNIALEKLNQTGGNVSQANLAKGDAYFFNGDINKWKKFTYGILARAYSRGSNRADFNLADSVIFACNNSLTTNDDNGYVRFAATALGATNNFFGPFRANLTGTAVTGPTFVKQSKFIVDLMTGAANSAFAGVFDPRSFYMLRLNSSNPRTYRGVETLLGQGAITPTAAQPENFWGQASSATTIPPNDTNCRFIFRNNSPIPVITASEIAFIKAEILFKKGDKTGALAAYKDGIDKNIDMLRNVYNVNIRPLDSALTDAKKNAFLNNTKVVPANPAQLTLSNIMLQKYISLYIHGALETWVDMRKYHYTDLDPATNNQVYFGFRVPSATDLFQDNNGKLVYRMRPRFNSEYVWNINELKLIGATTPDYHTKQTWFSQ
ncbi:MAG: SusD/RagB family nutrient-binding outer membrane lipoprotein [Sediminibacterium sp.]|nr:SusD/RagB family nutrient-binding outer membrane lipoprotein [Sediminibacterium sp.]